MSAAATRKPKREHAPTPWSRDRLLGLGSIIDADNQPVANTVARRNSKERQANTDFIVEAVNNYERLEVENALLCEALQEWQRLDNIKGLDRQLRNTMKQRARSLTLSALTGRSK